MRVDNTEVIFQLILHGGNARSLAMEAITLAKNGDIPGAQNALARSTEELNKAHHFQTSLIQQEASGQQTEINMLLIHAQDHVMNAITIKELAGEFVELYGRIRANKEAEV